MNNTQNKRTLTRKTKQQTINNKYIDAEDCIEPGEKYSNWISISKTKLRKREFDLLVSRIKICDKIIISSMNHFSTSNTEAFKKHQNSVHIQVQRMESDNLTIYKKEIQNKIVDTNSVIMRKCDEIIIQYLQKWNGIQRATETFVTFPKYYKQSKKWWDQRKIQILSINFWLPMIGLIEEFTKKASAEFFCNRFFDLQNKYSKFLNIVIINNLCEGTMKMGNSPDRLIIPAGSYKTFSKTAKSVFYPNSLNQMNNKYMGNKFIRTQLLQEIRKKHGICKNEFQNAMLALHYEVDNYGKKNQTETETNQSMACNLSVNTSISSNESTNTSISPLSIPYNNFQNYSPSYNNYNSSPSNIYSSSTSNIFNSSPSTPSTPPNAFNSRPSYNNYNNNSPSYNYNNMRDISFNGFHNSNNKVQDARFNPY